MKIYTDVKSVYILFKKYIKNIDNVKNTQYNTSASRKYIIKCKIYNLQKEVVFMEDIQLENLNVQKLKLRAGEHIDRDTILNLRGTKALVLENMLNNNQKFTFKHNCGELPNEVRHFL